MELKQKSIDYNSINQDTKGILLNEINNHLLIDDKPSEYFITIIDTPIF